MCVSGDCVHTSHVSHHSSVPVCLGDVVAPLVGCQWSAGHWSASGCHVVAVGVRRRDSKLKPGGSREQSHRQWHRRETIAEPEAGGQRPAGNTDCEVEWSGHFQII